MSILKIQPYIVDETKDFTFNNVTGKIILSNNTSQVAKTEVISDGTLSLNLEEATIFNVSLNSNITTFNITNVQAAGSSSSFVLILINDGTARTIIWPESFKWNNSTAPSLTTTEGKKDIFVFFTVDGGTSYQAFRSGQNI
jgi:hypothetical protein